MQYFNTEPLMKKLKAGSVKADIIRRVAKKQKKSVDLVYKVLNGSALNLDILKELIKEAEEIEKIEKQIQYYFDEMKSFLFSST